MVCSLHMKIKKATFEKVCRFEYNTLSKRHIAVAAVLEKIHFGGFGCNS